MTKRKTRRSLSIPIQRNGSGRLAQTEGDDVHAVRVRNVLMTRGDTARTRGELPWRTAFGAGIDALRHRPATSTTEALAVREIEQAFTRWLPDLMLVGVPSRTVDNRIELRVVYRTPDGLTRTTPVRI